MQSEPAPQSASLQQSEQYPPRWQTGRPSTSAAHVHGLPGVMIHDYATGAHRLVTDLRDSGELRAIFERAAGERAAGP